MKVLTLTLLSLAALISQSAAVSISLGTTTTGSRFFLSDGTTGVPNAGMIEVGYMTNENDATSFVTFGAAAAFKGNAAFGTSNGGMGNNAYDVASGNLVAARGVAVYIRAYNAATLGASGNAGIWKTTDYVYPADFAVDSTNAALPSLSAHEWATVNPSTNWAYKTPVANFNTNGTTGVASGTARSGNVFTLGNAVPEPTSFTLAGLAVVGLIAKRRRE